MAENKATKFQKQLVTTPLVDQAMIKPFMPEDLSEEQTLQAIFTEEYHATKTEIMTNCPPLERTLASQPPPIGPRIYLTARKNALTALFYEFKHVFLAQAHILEVLELESEMFEAMLLAGVALHSWLLHPITTDLAERLGQRTHVLARLHVFGQWAMLALRRIMAVKERLTRVQAEKEELATETPAMRKRARDETEEEWKQGELRRSRKERRIEE